jgi:hypothetical protein
MNARSHQLDIDASMQPFAETKREFKHAIIGSQDNYVARRVQDSRADFAIFKVLLDNRSRLFGKSGVQVIRDVGPNVFAIYDHGSHLFFDV